MIRSRQNQTIKTIRALRRRQGEHVLLEGAHLLAEALDSGIVIGDTLVTPEFAERPEGAALLARLHSPPRLVAAPVLASVADTDSPQGILAVGRLRRGGVEALPRCPGGTYLFLDAVQEPGNLGAIARAAEAFGVSGLALGAGCAHPNHPRALRASAGSLLRLPAALDADPDALNDRLAEFTPRWIGLVSHGGREPRALDFETTSVLVLGSEGQGLSPGLMARLDERWSLRLHSPVESLNVAVAAGVVLHQMRQGREERG